MVPLTSCHSTISYRPIRPSDLEILEKIHGDLFPIRYESEFFQDVAHGHGIVSWAAVDHSRDDGKGDELIGFITVRVVLATESEIVDLLKYDSAESELSLVYILTLGVVDSYRNLGIASSLIIEVIKYASSIPNCRAVYLHVISYNFPAIHLYKKMSFKCIRRLPGFYLIDGQYYDSYLFVYFVKGCQSPYSPLELVTAIMRYVRSGFQSISAKLWSNERKVGWMVQM
ncbi:histone acetyltransferase MCC1-like isoform X2 [Syzygium oleosum]|uniref:histone acetyltransferase MCC1-like isoform X2 n=1 Tax=Syzygium oleosum TaxID=219896 RepID=UPI0011D1C715|nr:histone acetyltransferase MCC1-like isoform X2 [Syzygium oleosum]